MKGLLFAFGLIPALFLSTAQASIFDTATSLSPKTSGVLMGDCPIDASHTTLSECKSKMSAAYPDSGSGACYTSDGTYSPNNNKSYLRDWPSGSGEYHHWETVIEKCGTNELVQTLNRGYIFLWDNAESEECPPEGNTTHVYQHDNDQNGKSECYNPNELDTLSNCASSANGGNLLPLGTNNSSKVCATGSDGSSCGYSQVSAGNSSYYMVDLEINCFGDSDVPEYEPESDLEQPQPEECKPYGSAFVCSADPSDYCDANSGVCESNCGYVNNQFVCFRDEACTGTDCDTPTDPTDPDPTDPNEPCTGDDCTDPDPTDPDPTDPDPTDPDSNTGGSGGGTLSIDYAKLGELMKDAAKTLIDEELTPDFSDTQSEIDDKDAELTQSFDDFMSGDFFGSIQDKIQEPIFSNANFLPDGGGCTVFDFGEHQINICEAAERIRSLLFYIFSILTFIYLKNLFYSTVTPTKE